MFSLLFSQYSPLVIMLTEFSFSNFVICLWLVGFTKCICYRIYLLPVLILLFK